jgi:phage terminase small subunit
MATKRRSAEPAKGKRTTTAKPKATTKAAKPAPAKKAKSPPKKRGSSTAESRPHKPEAAGSTPAPATASKHLLAAKPVEPDLVLTPEHEAFVTEYLRNNRNGTAAYLSVYPDCSPASAYSSASRLLRHAKVAARIRSELARLTEKHEMSRDDLFAELLLIVRADPNELTQMRHIACDECWQGADRPVARRDGMAKLSAWHEPDPDCEACNGEGIYQPWFADTRKLSREARALFAGVKETQHGIQILTHSKLDAYEKLAKILGAYEKDNEQKGKSVGAAMAEFLGQLHSAGAGRLQPVARTKGKA